MVWPLFMAKFSFCFTAAPKFGTEMSFHVPRSFHDSIWVPKSINESSKFDFSSLLLAAPLAWWPRDPFCGVVFDRFQFISAVWSADKKGRVDCEGCLFRRVEAEISFFFFFWWGENSLVALFWKQNKQKKHYSCQAWKTEHKKTPSDDHVNAYDNLSPRSVF